MTLDERISRYLAKCPPAISGSDGHGTTFRVACALVNGFALEPAEALRHLTAYNATCCPPWKPRDLRHKIEQADKANHQMARGHLLGKRETQRPGSIFQPPKLIPVRLKPRERQLRTVRTVFFNPYAHARRCAHTCTCLHKTSKQSSEPSVSLLDDLIPVPSCILGRPAEIEMADADWLAAERSGLLGEPIIQAALAMFGPGCTVVKTGRADA